jgi:hypothetical protein
VCQEKVKEVNLVRIKGNLGHIWKIINAINALVRNILIYLKPNNR